jgi:hypothetical protein
MSGIDRLVFVRGVTIGAFRCAVNHPSFEIPTDSRRLLVFPRTAVVIEHEHGVPSSLTLPS